MNRYENGKIYKITDVCYTTCYIGSTCESLSQRMARHREKYKHYQKTGKKHTNVVLLFDEFGVDNCKIELIEYYPSENKTLLQKREGHYIKTLTCINKRVEGRTQKEYREENKERLTERSREWYENNREYCTERARLKREIFNEEINEQQRQSYYRHQAEINERRREQYDENKEQVNERRRELYIKNKSNLSEKRKEKIECECGSIVRKADMSKHIKTNKHQSFIATSNKTKD